jgi:hypothetical protein
MGSERHYELRFVDEQQATAALTEGLQRSPHTGQIGEPSHGRHGCSAYFVTLDDDEATAESSVVFFSDLAARHGGEFVGVR